MTWGMMTGMEPLLNPARALVVTAHPDDAEFGAGGAIAHLVQGGCAVSYCVLTDGDAGGFDPTVPRSQIPGIRRAEQRASAAALGIRDVVFLGHLDGQLTVTQDLRRDITRVIRQVRPQLVITHSPDRNHQKITASHPDHLAVGEATLQAVYPHARNPFAYPSLLADEGLSEWAVDQVWMMGHERPNFWFDITDTLELKLTAIRAHASQLAHLPDLREKVIAGATRGAQAGGLRAGRLAEAYTVVDTRS